jgi:hypothetical protein
LDKDESAFLGPDSTLVIGAPPWGTGHVGNAGRPGGVAGGQRVIMGVYLG